MGAGRDVGREGAEPGQVRRADHFAAPCWDRPGRGRHRGGAGAPTATMIPDVVDGPSEHHLNLMSAAGERVSIYLDSDRAPPELPTDVLDALDRADIAVIDLAALVRAGARRRADAGCRIWCDLHDYDGWPTSTGRSSTRPTCWRQRRPAHRPGGVPRRMRGQRHRPGGVHPRSEGARAYSRTEGRWRVDAIAVDRVVDGTAPATPSWRGLRPLGDGRSLAESLRWATAVGALCVQSIELVSPAISRVAGRSPWRRKPTITPVVTAGPTHHRREASYAGRSLAPQPGAPKPARTVGSRPRRHHHA